MKTLPVILVFGMVFTLLAGAVNAGGNEKTENEDTYNAKFYGVIESMPESGWEGIWVVNGREILITGDTRIEEEHGKAEVGAYVEVEGNYVEKTFTVYKIEIRMDRREEKQ
jgi:hypothetical protein